MYFCAFYRSFSLFGLYADKNCVIISKTKLENIRGDVYAYKNSKQTSCCKKA